MGESAQIFRFSDIDWERPENAPPGVKELAEKGWRENARRKRMAQGQGGFFLEHSYLPPGFEIPPHRHNHGELFVVLEGAAKLSDGRWLTDYDAAYIPADQEYGFTVGPIGLRFVVIRGGAAETSLSP